MYVILLCVAIAVILTWQFFRYKSNYWIRRGVPQIPNGRLVFGHFTPSVNMTRSFGEVCADLYQQIPQGSPLAGAYIFTKPAIVIKDPDILKCVLVKDFSSFHDRGLYINEDVDPLSGHLFLLAGSRWRALRNKLSPTFTSGKMKMMFQVVAECAAELCDVMKNAEQEMEMRDLLSRYAADVIGSCAFGIKCDCLRNPESHFRQWGIRFVKPTNWQALVGAFCFAVPKIANTLGIRTIPKDVNDYFISLVADTLQYRKSNNVVRNDFFQLLMQLMEKGYVADPEASPTQEGQPDTLSKMSLPQIAAQATIFFIAGFETSSATMAFALHELALHPDIQDRLQAEIDSTLEKYGGKVTYECLSDMPYLEMVISETLRKYPVVPVLNREVSNDYQVQRTDWILEKGTSVIIPVLAMHHDPALYPDPFVFDPERFSEENKANRNNYTYLPFGEGPRICIGLRFGLMQTKLGLIEMLSNFSFRLCDRSNQAEFARLDPLSFIMNPSEGIWLKVLPRPK